MNPFDLLGDDDNDDVSQLVEKIAAAPPKKAPPAAAGKAAAPPAKLPSKPLPPAQAVREAKNEGGRGGRGYGRGGTGYGGKYNTMNKSKDPFEVAAEESPPDSPVGHADIRPQDPAVQPAVKSKGADVGNSIHPPNQQKAIVKSGSTSASAETVKNKEDDDEEEEENMDVELGKFPSSSDPAKLAKMQSILSQFTEVQMNRYESFRRSGFQKSVMKRLLGSITGSNKVSMPMTIVVSGIAKIFVGELVETARVVMRERKESGPIRPCHIREAYRRLKLEGKIPKRSVQRLFR